MTIPYATAANQVPVSIGQGTIYTAQTLPDLTTIVTLDGVQTLTNKTLTSPRIGVGLLDTNGAQSFQIGAIDSAVNYIHLDNAPIGSSPSFFARGSDAAVGMNFLAKGIGFLRFGGPSTTSISVGQSLPGNPLIGLYGAPAVGQGAAEPALTLTVAGDMPGPTAAEITVRLNLIENRCNAISTVLRNIGMIA